MPKKILTIGFELASGEVASEEFTSKASLLDWDIVLFRPTIEQFTSYASEYKGKPSLSDSMSFQLKEACEHWRREIKQAVESGKTVIVFLSPLEEVYIDTGERQYSGSGRSRATTRILELLSNYAAIPATLQLTNARGSSVKLAPNRAEVFAQYWSEFGKYTEYEVVVGSTDYPACFLTKAGDKSVGVLIRSKNSSGSLVCIPDLDFYPAEFFGSEEGEPDEEEPEGALKWTVEAETFAHRMIGAVVSLDASLRGDDERTPEPHWASDAAFSLKAEETLRVQLLQVEAQLEKVQRKKEALAEKLKGVTDLRSLLFEKGKPLERAIIEALRILGFSASPFKDTTSEFDAVFQASEGRLLGEAEGKDSKAVNVDKLRQLAMNIHEDLQRDEVTSPAKGVLFGNGFRLVPPSERQGVFTTKCIGAALSSGTALVSTQDLFEVARYLSEQNDSAYAAACRSALVNGVGLTPFPSLPVDE